MKFLGKVLNLMLFLLPITMALVQKHTVNADGEPSKEIEKMRTTNMIRRLQLRFSANNSALLDSFPQTYIHHPTIDFTLPRNQNIVRVKHILSRYPLVLEVAVVLTAGVRNKFANKRECKNFILSTIKQVHDYYQLPSLGVKVSIQLKNLFILSLKQSKGINVPDDTIRTLWNFQNIVSRSGLTADAVLLITDVFRSGRAFEVGKLCESGKNTAVVGYNGFKTAYGIVHQLGHMIGLNHPSRFCHERSDEEQFIMASSTDFQNKDRITWSRCSRSEVPFLLRDRMNCLLHTSNVPYAKASQYKAPGEYWNMTRQCEMKYGAGFSVDFETGLNECESVFCKKITKVTDEKECFDLKQMFPLEGSPCGRRLAHRCVDRKCLHRKNGRETVNGGWGDWRVVSKCDCNRAFETDIRKCSSPAPRNGGRECVGERIRHARMCASCGNNPRKPVDEDLLY